MTELPDTAAIRAKLSSQSMRTLAPLTIIRGLCDALDVARAELRIWEGAGRGTQRQRAEAAEERILELDLLIGMMRDDNNAVHDTAVHHAARAEAAAMVRAEVAEAQVREDVLALDEAYAMLHTALARAEAAEARITAALFIVEEMECDIPEDSGNAALHHVAVGLRRALTEGTGQ